MENLLAYAHAAFGSSCTSSQQLVQCAAEAAVKQLDTNFVFFTAQCLTELLHTPDSLWKISPPFSKSYMEELRVYKPHIDQRLKATRWSLGLVSAPVSSSAAGLQHPALTKPYPWRWAVERPLGFHTPAYS